MRIIRLGWIALLLQLACAKASVPPKDAASVGLRTGLANTPLPARVVQPIDANRFRVIAFNLGGVNLGQCSSIPVRQELNGNGQDFDAAGALERGICASGTQYWAWDKRASYPDDEPDRAKKWLGEFLNLGAFYQQSRSLDVKGTVEVGIPIGNGNGQASFSRRLLVMEWRRYVLRAMCEGKDDGVPECAAAAQLAITARAPASGGQQAAPADRGYVSGVEWGVAVRVFFDVKLVQTDVEASAKFGFASLATALATGQASVEVSYDVIGTADDLLPQEPTIITGVGEYISAVQRFYKAAWQISQGLDSAQRALSDLRVSEAELGRLKALQPPGVDDARVRHQLAVDEATKTLRDRREAKERTVSRYPLGLVSYYVSGDNASRVFSSDSTAARAQRGYEQKGSSSIEGPTAE